MKNKTFKTKDVDTKYERTMPLQEGDIIEEDGKTYIVDSVKVGKNKRGDYVNSYSITIRLVD